MDDSTSTTYLSRSALAEQLGLSLKELTQALINAGWLRQQDNKQWELTAKGEFEGGEYRESKKYGRYIVWPSSVSEHAVFVELQQSRINATAIAKHFQLSAKSLNRLLAEMGWISPFAKGWQLTASGKRLGGYQETHQDSGAPYVVWSRDILASDYLLQNVQCYKGEGEGSATLDGRHMGSKAEAAIANYLYLAGFVYSYQSTQAIDKTLSITTDFYLPKERIHLFYEPDAVAPDALNDRLDRQALVKQYELLAISITDSEIDELDSLLARKLLGLGVSEPYFS